ncbi:cold shock domain-containing protein [Streptomyces spiramenti]|uniref:Cold shock domain-containing protein n=1 Tax=Streptomyces spiramenti TaxID=2720606 RepID=A0ABX1ACP0_9ACTN|nr:cold shock domain-containing protein [Streptomyces spiramenti]
MRMIGKILRFDEVRGYGFIVPEEGHEDVFMHANDLMGEKYLYQAGREVEFEMEMGDKGPKASRIRLVDSTSGEPPLPPRAAAPAARSSADNGGDQLVDGEVCDILTRSEFRVEITEALIAADGDLTAQQIRRIRDQVASLASSHGWVDN